MSTPFTRRRVLEGAVAAGAVAAFVPRGVRAADPAACQTVRFSDVGWSCITATTAIASTILEGLGYEPEATILSQAVTFESLKTGDIDAFIGLWLPSGESMIRPYLDEGSIEVVVTNLTGAKYTMAVPKYVHDGGVKEFGDLQKFKDKFDGKLYGIEPGNDGNMLIQQMIDENAFDLGGWELVESSEAGMLSQVERGVRTEDWIVFLGWEPHPMNKNFDMAYLAGGDEWFGPNFGGATVYTLAHAGYREKCPNVGRFLANLTFTLALENAMMSSMLDEDMEPDKAAERLLKEQPDLLTGWLEGVTTLDGAEDGVTAVKRHLGLI